MPFVLAYYDPQQVAAEQFCTAELPARLREVVADALSLRDMGDELTPKDVDVHCQARPPMDDTSWGLVFVVDASFSQVRHNELGRLTQKIVDGLAPYIPAGATYAVTIRLHTDAWATGLGDRG